MQSLWERAKLAIFLLLANLAMPAFGQEKDATHTVESLIYGLRQLDAAFDPGKNSFRVHYRQDRIYFDIKGQEIVKTWVDADYARKGGMAYIHLIRNNPREGAGEREEVDVWKDRVTVQRQKTGLTVVPYILPQLHNYYDYTDGLSMDCRRLLEWTNPMPLPPVPQVKTVADLCFYMLPRMIEENRRHYILRGKQEQMDGVWCHVLEWPKHDRIWIAADYGCVVRKRILSAGEGKPMTQWVNRKFVERKRGLWLPDEQEVTIYHNAGEHPELAGKVRIAMKTRLLQVSFAPLKDDFFKVPADQGEKLYVNDGVRKMNYVKHPEGIDPMAAALSDARMSHASRYRTVWWLVNGILVGSAFLARRGWQWREKRFEAAQGK